MEVEIDRVTNFVQTQGKLRYAQDELMLKVFDFVVNEHTVSTSKLQRVFSIVYNRTVNLIDTLENKTYISKSNGSKPRDVFLTPQGFAEINIPQSN